MNLKLIVLLFLCFGAYTVQAQHSHGGVHANNAAHRAFNNALLKGNHQKAAAILRRRLYRYDRRKLLTGDFDKSAFAVAKTLEWLSMQPNVKQIVADTCGVHICIWPGWVDYSIIAKSDTGWVEYGYTVQLGRTHRIGYWAGSWWRHRPKFLYFKPEQGRLASFLNNCKVEEDNNRRALNDNRLRFNADHGRLNWSVNDAPKFEDSEHNTLRFKLELENLSTDTLRLAYPIHQNAGKKLVYLKFHDAIKPQSFVELRNIELILNEDLKGPDTLVLAPGERFSQWHSFNDEINADGNLLASHKIHELPTGKYRIQIIYNPPESSAGDSTLWRPSYDSISAWLPYIWQYNKPEIPDTFSITGEVTDGPSEYETEYDFKGEYISRIKILASEDISSINIGDTIAWKFKAESRLQNTGRPLSLEKFQITGNKICLVIDRNYPGQALRNKGYKLFAIFKNDVKLRPD
ncbi:MAG: hypothetical protein ACK5CY_08290 [Bacteroidia bacterium]|jgi:hypothetical protein